MCFDSDQKRSRKKTCFTEEKIIAKAAQKKQKAQSRNSAPLRLLGKKVPKVGKKVA